MNLLILYFSGAGSTKTVAELMHKILKAKCNVMICSIDNAKEIEMNHYDAFIIGTPVYHGAPARMIKNYVQQMIALNHKRPVFIFNTRALWSCNTNRILAKYLRKKNIITVMNRNYRSPASDGILIAPFIERFSQFQKDIESKVMKDCTKFYELMNANTIIERMPHFQLNSIPNAPNKLLGQMTTFRIYVHKENCKQCMRCIRQCPHQALFIGEDQYPIFIKENCENCYRCIHHCPGKALSLSKKKTPCRLLN